MWQNLQVIVPLAGPDGLLDAFSLPKPLIPVRGKPLVKFCTDLLGWPFTAGGIRRLAFGIQRDVDQAFGLGSTLRDLYSEFDPAVVVLDGFTEGAACTVLEIMSRLEVDFLAEEPLLIHLADVAFTADLEQAIASLPPECSGAIPAFSSDNPKFSYLATGEDGRVTMTAEKEAISSLASAGSYLFRETREFLEAARSAIAAEEKVRGSYFICPLYNHLIRRGNRVMPIPVEYVANLGDATELRAFSGENCSPGRKP